MIVPCTQRSARAAERFLSRRRRFIRRRAINDVPRGAERAALFMPLFERSARAAERFLPRRRRFIRRRAINDVPRGAERAAFGI
jgi:hypothetical protein